MKLLNDLLKVKTEARNSLQIIGWWEIRRILYNLIVLAAGILSIGIMLALVKLEPGEDLQEPFAIFGFGILCNLGYSLGWLTEIFSAQSKEYLQKTPPPPQKWYFEQRRETCDCG